MSEPQTVVTLHLGEHGRLRFEHRLNPQHLQLTAQLWFTRCDGEPRAHPALEGITYQVYAEIEGLGRAFATVLADSAEPGETNACALRFQFTPDQIIAVRAGADFGFGIDDDRMRVGAKLKSAHVRWLLDTA